MFQCLLACVCVRMVFDYRVTRFKIHPQLLSMAHLSYQPLNHPKIYKATTRSVYNIFDDDHIHKAHFNWSTTPYSLSLSSFNFVAFLGGIHPFMTIKKTILKQQILTMFVPKSSCLSRYLLKYKDLNFYMKNNVKKWNIRYWMAI